MKRPTGIRLWLVLGLLILSVGGGWLGEYVGGNVGQWYQLFSLIAGILLAVLVIERLLRKSWQGIQEIQRHETDCPDGDQEDNTPSSKQQDRPNGRPEADRG